jgi:hypothetical protein
VHVQPSRAVDQRTERIEIAQEPAAVAVRDAGRVEGHVAAGADAGGVRTGPPHDVDPERQVECHRIVLGQRELVQRVAVRCQSALRSPVIGREIGPVSVTSAPSVDLM